MHAAFFVGFSSGLDWVWFDLMWRVVGKRFAAACMHACSFVGLFFGEKKQKKEIRWQEQDNGKK
jgi:hypothetical protein